MNPGETWAEKYNGGDGDRLVEEQGMDAASRMKDLACRPR